jgi:hypothetical protein
MNNKEYIEAEIRGLKILLEDSDYKAIKYAEGLISESDYAETKAYRQNLRQQINDYEKELDALS